MDTLSRYGVWAVWGEGGGVCHEAGRSHLRPLASRAILEPHNVADKVSGG